MGKVATKEGKYVLSVNIILIDSKSKRLDGLLLVETDPGSNLREHDRHAMYYRSRTQPWKP